MSHLNRRHFLQFAGSTLATLGLSHIDFCWQADRYGQVLAQSSPRKFALLVGINDYPTGIRSLNGCLTDVELQWELLVNRFGFSPQDILVVADYQLSCINYNPLKPTRQNILDTFEQHLIKNAKPGDIVVFHYSGHGSIVLDDRTKTPWLKDAKGRGINGTLVPYDRRLPDTRSDEVRDIMGHTLFLLMLALKTQNVTVVMDSCHSGGGTRGNLQVRSTTSRLDGGKAKAFEAEWEYQARWIRDLNLSKNVEELQNAGIAKGVAIGSARYNQEAADAPFSGFSAGAFTYLLTRYLWQRTREEGLGKVFVNLALGTKDVANISGVVQEPIYESNPVSNHDLPFYFLTPTTPAAEAVIRGEKNGLIEFWLGGVSARSIATTEKSLFTILDAAGQPVGEIEQTHRSGLVGYGKLRQGNPSAVVAGRLLREQIRMVPADLKLAIVLDESLTEQQAAKDALKLVNRVEVVANSRSVQGSYRLGRVTKEIEAAQSKERLTIGSIGLFTARQEPLSTTFGQADESVRDAVQRLRPRLISLLAGQILQASLSDAQRLQVETAVMPLEAGTMTMVNGIPQFQSGQPIQVQIRNREAQNLYIAVLVIAATGDLTVLYPYWDAPDIAALVAPNDTVMVPRPDDPFQFALSGSSGFAEILVLASTQPLRDSVKTLETIGRGRGYKSRSPVPLQESEPLDIIQALVGDLDRNSRAGARIHLGKGRAIDTMQLSAISNVIAVVQAIGS